MIDHSHADKMPALTPAFFARKAQEVAPSLVGCYLFTTISDRRVGGMIVETEAYDQDDLAAHCYCKNGEVPRPTSKPMLLSGGHAYFYYTRFGRCFNITCDSFNFGSAVLIRQLLPTTGQDVMRQRRLAQSDSKALSNDKTYLASLCNGPQNLCDALGICDSLHQRSLVGLSVLQPPFELRQPTEQNKIDNLRFATTREGVDKQLARKFPSLIDSLAVNEAIQKKWRWKIKTPL